MRNLLILLTFGTLLLQAGCSSDPFRKATIPEPGPTGLDEQQFDDVPVPRGFRLDTRQSFSYRTGQVRTGQFRYEGTRLTAGQALRHYEREMIRPLYGWALAEIDREGGSATFRKGPDEARVTCKNRTEFTRVIVDVNYPADAPRTEE